jgi:hypothetical protein
MARQIRIEYDGAAYPVMTRGNQGQAIYADALHRRVWLETLTEACEKTSWRIHACVMMSHHYHLKARRETMLSGECHYSRPDPCSPTFGASTSSERTVTSPGFNEIL